MQTRSCRKRFNDYKRNAARRGYKFELTFEEFDKFTRSGDCIYCKRHFNYLGIDRIFNYLGYEFGNIVPCCKECNSMKGTMTYVQFIKVCSLIAKNHRYIY